MDEDPGMEHLGFFRVIDTEEDVIERDVVSMVYYENENAPPVVRVAQVDRIDKDITGNVMVRVKLCYRPEDTIGGRRPFHGKKELFLTDHFHTQSSDTILRKCVLHNFLRYTRLKAVGIHDYFTRLHYDHETGWFSPDTIEVYCKCLLPYNPDEYMLQCQACKDWYHPACLNMTKDEAKLLDNFTCDREQCLDGNRPHNQSSASADLDMVLFTMNLDAGFDTTGNVGSNMDTPYPYNGYAVSTPNLKYAISKPMDTPYPLQTFNTPYPNLWIRREKRRRQGGDFYGCAQVGLYLSIWLLHSTDYLKYRDGTVVTRTQ
ncbi:chromatin remodeling protein EBS-like protein [Tanacetum coccineum]